MRGISAAKLSDGCPGLTLRQERVLRLVYVATCRDGAPPTARELMACTGDRSTNAIFETLSRLEVKGYLARPDAYAARAMAITALPVFSPGPDGVAVLGGFIPIGGAV